MVGVEELFDCGGSVGGEVVDDAVQFEVCGDSESSSARNATKLSERIESVGAARTSPVAHSNAANSEAVPLRRYSNSCWAGRPLGLATDAGCAAACAARVGLVRLLACIPVFSSTLNTAQFCGGCR